MSAAAGPWYRRLLLGRMLLLTLLAVLLAQGLSSLFWISHLRSSQRDGLLTSSRSLAYSMAASVRRRRSSSSIEHARWCWTSCAAWAARASSSRSTSGC